MSAANVCNREILFKFIQRLPPSIPGVSNDVKFFAGSPKTREKFCTKKMFERRKKLLEYGKLAFFGHFFRIVYRNGDDFYHDRADMYLLLVRFRLHASPRHLKKKIFRNELPNQCAQLMKFLTKLFVRKLFLRGVGFYRIFFHLKMKPGTLDTVWFPIIIQNCTKPYKK